jgi:hypothetical protein
MAVRCPGCGRLSRDETVCEWCRSAIPPQAQRLAAAGARNPEEASGVSEGSGEASSGMAEPPTLREVSESNADAVSQREADAAAVDSADEDRVDGAPAEDAGGVAVVETVEVRQDRDTLVILALILVQWVLTLYLGRLSSWWSVTGFLWLLVGYGVWVRASWSLALPLVLFTLDVALLLFGVGPRERAGFPALAPMDFLLYLLRFVIWGLVWSLRDEMA